MRDVSDKSCREKQNTFCVQEFFVFVSPPQKKKCAVYEMMWKNVVELDRPQITVWHMCIACWISKATNTSFEYVILFCFSMATMVACVHLYIVLCIQHNLFYFSMKWCLFCNFIFFCFNNTEVFINHELKFKYQTRSFKG